MNRRRQALVSTNKRIVSIVDDELDHTILFHDALCSRIKDISVVSFSDPVIALDHFTDNKETYALVISDLRIPRLSGLELLKKVKGLNPKVRTMLTSAYEFENDKVFRQYMNQGIKDEFIQKPMTMTCLCREVNNQIHAHQLAIKKY